MGVLLVSVGGPASGTPPREPDSMLLAHPEATQGDGGQRTSPEIADARQAPPGAPRSPRFAPDAAGRLAVWFGPIRRCGSASMAGTGPGWRDRWVSSPHRRVEHRRRWACHTTDTLGDGQHRRGIRARGPPVDAAVPRRQPAGDGLHQPGAARPSGGAGDAVVAD